MGVGAHAAETWGLTVPAWVKAKNLQLGVINHLQFLNNSNPGTGNDGSCGYRWPGGNEAETGACLIMMSEDGMAKTDAKWLSAENFLKRQFTTSAENHQNMYSMYNLAKGMRLAKDGSGNPSPITLLGGTIDWYGADHSTTNAGDLLNGLARNLVLRANTADGHWDSSNWVSGHLSTAWGILILSPALFEIGPTAVCKADAIVCSAGATCGAATVGAYSLANFDGSQSTAGDNAIASYLWTFMDGNTSTAVTTTHAFSTIGTYNVKLTVKDTHNNASSAICPVIVTDTALPPIASAGGPYTICKDQGGSVILDATRSIGRGANIVSYAWDFTTPINFSPVDATTATTNQTAYFNGLAPGTYSVGVKITDDSQSHFTTSAFSSVTVKAANHASCNKPPVAVADTASTFSGTPVTVAVLANDSDPDPGQTLTVTGTSGGPTNGTVVVNGGITITYTPNLGFAGVDVFTYAISDGHGGTASATVTITVTKRAVTATAGSGTNVYDGVTHAPSACVVTGAYIGDLTCTNSPASAGPGVGSTPTTPSVSGTGLTNYAITPVNGSYSITPAPSFTVVTCTPSVVYNGSAQTVCSANVTGAGGLNQAVTPVTYSNNTNVGTASASATYVPDANHFGSTGTGSFTITPAPSTTSVTAPTITYAANGAITVTVTSAPGTVPGNVTLTVDGGAPLTQALSGGSTTFTVASPNAGDHALVAAFSAQGNFAASSATGNLHVNQSPTATTLTSTPSAQAAGQTVTLTATVVAVAPGSGVPNGTVTFMDGTTTLGTAPVNAGVAVFTTTSLAIGPHSITAAYSGSSNYIRSSASAVSQLIYGYPTGGGTFVIGNNNATLGGSVTFWGAQWEKLNSMTGGASTASFKGFATGPTPPNVGATFTAAPGNSAPSPSAVPAYIGIIVTSQVTKSGSNISGTIVGLVVVMVDPGYAGNPGHAGTGTIVAVLP